MTDKNELTSNSTGLALTEPRKQKFLELLMQNGNVSRCAAEIGVSYTTVSKHANKDPYFKECIEIAKAKFIGTLEDEAIRRGRDGVEEDVYFQGVVVGTKRVYSDKLLADALKANDPDKYATKTGPQTNNFAIIDGDSSVVSKLFSFVGVDDADKKTPQTDAEADIVEGEYQSIEDEDKTSQE